MKKETPVEIQESPEQISAGIIRVTLLSAAMLILIWILIWAIL
ncbi:MAG: hypothetical protein NUW37_05905 [Planctomycetes bacterium]|nr:hypothetical protein [Planctomycetota bacterium]